MPSIGGQAEAEEASDTEPPLHEEESEDESDSDGRQEESEEKTGQDKYLPRDSIGKWNNSKRSLQSAQRELPGNL